MLQCCVGLVVWACMQCRLVCTVITVLSWSSCKRMDSNITLVSHQFTCLSVGMYVCLSVCMSVPTRLSVCLCVSHCLSPQVCLLIHLHLCLSPRLHHPVTTDSPPIHHPSPPVQTRYHAGVDVYLTLINFTRSCQGFVLVFFPSAFMILKRRFSGYTLDVCLTVCVCPGHLGQKRQIRQVHQLCKPAGHVRCRTPQRSVSASRNQRRSAWGFASLRCRLPCNSFGVLFQGSPG